MTQALISKRSKAKYYNPHDIDEHTPDINAMERDELGLVRAISVKVRNFVPRLCPSAFLEVSESH